MTAEVVLMNREAVAMAADSAVTATTFGGRKVYNSANKLFKLSKYHPVGIMVYGAGNFIAIPWETVIKAYRDHIGSLKFYRLESYKRHFIKFLRQYANQQFGAYPQLSRDTFRYAVAEYIEFIVDTIDNEVQSISPNVRIRIGNSLDGLPENVRSNIISRALEIIEAFFSDLDHAQLVAGIPDNYAEQIAVQFGETIDNIIALVFGDFSDMLPQNSRQQLRQFAILMFMKERPIPGLAGVVVAGFGERDVFPACSAFFVDSYVNGFLKVRQDSIRSGKIGFDTPPILFPFAQDDMVSTFITGIDPRLSMFLQQALNNLIGSHSQAVVETIRNLVSNLSDEQQQELEEVLRIANSQNDNLLENFWNSAQQYTSFQITSPIIEAVSALPKDELAAMAENLVELTTFKRRVTIGVESDTVGGPTDVAVISKKDGFIWI